MAAKHPPKSVRIVDRIVGGFCSGRQTVAEFWIELHSKFVQLAPPFRKLRNPVLRRTVAHVTTLAQAARVAGVSIADLIQALRPAAGQALDAMVASAEEHPGAAAGPAPGSMRQGEVAAFLNADEVLGAGESPLATVQDPLRRLQPYQVLVIEGSLRPEPLIDLLRGQGHAIHVDERSSHRIMKTIGARA